MTTNKVRFPRGKKRPRTKRKPSFVITAVKRKPSFVITVVKRRDAKFPVPYEVTYVVRSLRRRFFPLGDKVYLHALDEMDAYIRAKRELISRGWEETPNE